MLRKNISIFAVPIFKLMKYYSICPEIRYKKTTKLQNFRSLLCDKSWILYQDSKQEENLVFQSDGCLLLIQEGDISLSHWEYMSSTQTLTLTKDHQTHKVHPIYTDHNLLILQKDESEEVVFLVNKNNFNSFSPKTLLDIKEYLIQNGTLFYGSKKKGEDFTKSGGTRDSACKTLRKIPSNLGKGLKSSFAAIWDMSVNGIKKLRN